MKTQNTYDRIKGYINHCIDDAIRSTDGAELRPQFWFRVVGNDMIFHVQICDPSVNAKAEATVIKKILWRLNTNIKKHFGFDFFAPAWADTYGDFLSDMYFLASPEEFSYNHALAKMEILGTTYILCGKFFNRPEDEDDTLIIKRGGLEMFCKPTWDQFYLAYVKAFGDDPLTVWNCMRLGEDPNMLNSEEYISKKAEGDLNTFGCKYYSVCNKACAKCYASGKCFRDKPIMKDGLVLSRYRDFKQELLMGN